MIGTDFWIRIVLAHLLGDYVCQNNWMATRKKKEWGPCIIHCAIYTLIMTLWLLPVISWGIVAGIFGSHIIIDKSGAVERWCKLIRSRSFAEAKDRFGQSDGFSSAVAVAYTAIVQTVTDNTFHFLLLYGVFALL